MRSPLSASSRTREPVCNRWRSLSFTCQDGKESSPNVHIWPWKCLLKAYQYMNLMLRTIWCIYRLFLFSKELRRLQTTSFTHHDTTILATTNLSFCVDHGREETEIDFQGCTKVPLPKQVPGLCKKSWEIMRNLQSNKSSQTKQNALKWLKH